MPCVTFSNGSRVCDDTQRKQLIVTVDLKKMEISSIKDFPTSTHGKVVKPHEFAFAPTIDRSSGYLLTVFPDNLGAIYQLDLLQNAAPIGKYPQPGIF